MQYIFSTTRPLLLTALILGLLAGAPAFAQEAVVAADAEPATTTSAADRDAARADIETQIAERRAVMNERSKERITNLAANVSNRMDAAVDRLQNVIDRLDSRMEKLTAAEVDTETAAQILASAQTSLDAATAQLLTIDVEVQAAVSAEDPRAAWQDVKALYQNIREQLQTSHAEIKATVTELKQAMQTRPDNQSPEQAPTPDVMPDPTL